MLLHAPHEERSHDGLRLRFRVWRQRIRLDKALAEGVDPAHDPALGLRARQLTDLSTRLAVARTIGNLLDAAQEPPDAWGRNGARPPLQREAIIGSRDDLLALSNRLRRPQSIPPQAVALATCLVWDSGSPLYGYEADAGASRVIRTVVEALDTSR